jgi:selenocysteine lyase/cysteine desulfurase
VPGLTLYGGDELGRGEDRIGVIPFALQGINHALLASALAWEGGVGVRHGCFCAHPFIARLLELDEADAETMIDRVLAEDRRDIPGLVRMSFGVFNTEAEIDRVVAQLLELAAHGPRGKYRFDAAFGEYHAEGCKVTLDPELGI